MHRHGYKGRKFHRETDQRRALIKGLAESIIINGSITTTLPKAKTLKPYIEKLVTKAKDNTLHSRRQVISSLQTVSSANRLVDEIAPKFAKRQGGYTRVNKTDTRRGDNAQMAVIEFVDESIVSKQENVSDNKDHTKTQESVKRKDTAKPALSPIKPNAKQAGATRPVNAKVVPKRAGVRGNK